MAVPAEEAHELSCMSIGTLILQRWFKYVSLSRLTCLPRCNANG
jgi:hypothetical protein